jgi:hypothetical protein
VGEAMEAWKFKRMVEETGHEGNMPPYMGGPGYILSKVSPFPTTLKNIFKTTN